MCETYKYIFKQLLSCQDTQPLSCLDLLNKQNCQVFVLAAECQEKITETLRELGTERAGDPLP